MSESGVSEKEVQERAFNQAAGNLIWPTLTRTNYQEWSSHVQCNLEGMSLWDAIEDDNVERRGDRLALGAMLRGVPVEMHSMLLKKKNVKEAWESLKTMRLGADRVKEVNAQKLLSEFEQIKFKPEETIDDFAIRISKLAIDLEGLGEKLDDSRVVKKFLRVVPARYNQIAVSIEMFCDLKTLKIEELVSRLRAAEDRFEPSVEQATEKLPKLLLTEEEWMAKNKSRMVQEQPQSSGGKGGKHYVRKDRHGARGGREMRAIPGTSNIRRWVHLDGKASAGSVASMATTARSAGQR